jgi:hypothetical protein
LPLSKRIALLIVVLLCAKPLVAQDRPPSSFSATSVGDAGRWEPLGPIPVDQAGAGRRGYVLPGESAEVTAPGADQVSFHTVAANNFYREETSAFLITQRYEAHTVALGYRRGFKVGIFPLFELGGQIQFHESDNGFLNGFISRFEGAVASLTGSQTAVNQLRFSPATTPPLGTFVTKDGRSIYGAPGGGSGFGDIYVVANALLRDSTPSSNGTRVAARIALNVAGKSEFTDGNFAGLGVSLDKKIFEHAAFHGDVRANIVLDRVSQWGLPLKRASFAFSAGPELKLASNSSLSLQIDGGTTPYVPTGAMAFDEGYGDMTLGLSHRFRAGQRHLVGQIYVRENMNLPVHVRWNTDPDVSVGMKITIQ